MRSEKFLILVSCKVVEWRRISYGRFYLRATTVQNNIGPWGAPASILLWLRIIPGEYSHTPTPILRYVCLCGKTGKKRKENVQSKSRQVGVSSWRVWNFIATRPVSYELSAYELFSLLLYECNVTSCADTSDYTTSKMNIKYLNIDRSTVEIYPSALLKIWSSGIRTYLLEYGI